MRAPTSGGAEEGRRARGAHGSFPRSSGKRIARAWRVGKPGTNGDAGRYALAGKFPADTRQRVAVGCPASAFSDYFGGLARYALAGRFPADARQRVAVGCSAPAFSDYFGELGRYALAGKFPADTRQRAAAGCFAPVLFDHPGDTGRFPGNTFSACRHRATENS